MSATSFKTPEGTAIYPWLNIPDTQFDPEDKYKTDLRVNAKDAAELVEAITQVNKEAHGPKGLRHEYLIRWTMCRGITSSVYKPSTNQH